MERGTRLIHTGSEGDPHTGAVSTPIYQNVIFSQPDVYAPGEWEYSRLGNPTRAALEKSIAVLEGGRYGFAFASGMAAIAAAFLMFGSGDHVLVSRDVYGGTFGLAHRLLPRYGIQVQFVDATDPDAVRSAIQAHTRAIFIETPSNPLMKITDLPAIAALAKEHGLLTMADNTFLTPYLQRPLEAGIDIVIHSATKYLGGHSDCLAGLVVTDDPKLAREFHHLQVSLGAVLGPQDSWIIARGLKTLKVRLEQQQQTAGRLAEWLLTRPEITTVYYPGLAAHEGREIHFRQADGPGAMLAFRLPDEEKARLFVNRLRLPVIASSLGAVESIVSMPVLMSHTSLPEEMQRELTLDRCLVRYSVGLEDFSDLQADLEQALVGS
ncbi:MAG: PLP-dependent aspartate aminotransferase family protein [Syntrophomonas sp.]|nr:PLP-dependent aspartate aminotransferase family protein [Syntrophomonas sp.]